MKNNRFFSLLALILFIAGCKYTTNKKTFLILECPKEGCVAVQEVQASSFDVQKDYYIFTLGQNKVAVIPTRSNVVITHKE